MGFPVSALAAARGGGTGGNGGGAPGAGRSGGETTDAGPLPVPEHRWSYPDDVDLYHQVDAVRAVLDPESYESAEIRRVATSLA